MREHLQLETLMQLMLNVIMTLTEQEQTYDSSKLILCKECKFDPSIPITLRALIFLLRKLT